MKKNKQNNKLFWIFVIAFLIIILIPFCSEKFKLKETTNKIKTQSLGLANLRFCYWYLLANEIKTAKEKIKKAMNLYPQFLFDPRWHGLNLLCRFPQLKDKWIFDLEEYH